jgi:hypothetical protein
LKKTVYTLNIDNYAPEISEITFPFMKAWAHKIGAAFHVISERKFPQFDPGYEKMQIFELGREAKNDWNIYLDSDALVHPDMLDVTTYLTKDTVAHNGKDVIGNRYREDKYHWRDGRHISSCNWFTIASDWCLDLWHPLDDLTPEEAKNNIFPTVNEVKGGVTKAHLIDDYVLSRNIARFGLKFVTVIEILKLRCGYEANFMMHHLYAIPLQEKIIRLRQTLAAWGLT